MALRRKEKANHMILVDAQGKRSHTHIYIYVYSNEKEAINVKYSSQFLEQIK